MSKYFYGEIDQEKYYHQDIEECVIELLELAHEENPTFEIVEMEISERSGYIFCTLFDDSAECIGLCLNYENGKKSEWCEFAENGLIETGATWEYKNDKLKELTGRTP